MSHTNSTPNYNLPQFVTTDKPAWLTDINGAFSAIDTGIDAAKDAADAAQGDATQALTDAGNAGTAASAADAKGSGAVASIANTFDATSTYAVGDRVMYNSLLYVCTVAVTTPGAWTGSTNWSRVNIDKIIKDLDASDISYGERTVAAAIFALADDTFSVTKGPTMPSAFPTPSYKRRGFIVEMSFAIQLPAGTYSNNDVLWTLSKTPSVATRAIVQLGGQDIILNLLADGTVKFNVSQTLGAATWMIGEAIFIVEP